MHVSQQLPPQFLFQQGVGVAGELVFCILSLGHSESQVEPTAGEASRGSQAALNPFPLKNQLEHRPSCLSDPELEGSKLCRGTQTRFRWAESSAFSEGRAGASHGASFASGLAPGSHTPRCSCSELPGDSRPSLTSC